MDGKRDDDGAAAAAARGPAFGRSGRRLALGTALALLALGGACGRRGDLEPPPKPGGSPPAKGTGG